MWNRFLILKRIRQGEWLCGKWWRGVERITRGRKKHGITWRLIPCFLRHLSEEDARQTWKELIPFREHFSAIGLDSSEKGNPPSKFAKVFEEVRASGLLAVAHAGEEGPASSIREALEKLKVVRVDHGVRCVEDPELVLELAKKRVPLTTCPLSNIRLCVYKKLSDHPLKKTFGCRGKCYCKLGRSTLFWRLPIG